MASNVHSASMVGTRALMTRRPHFEYGERLSQRHFVGGDLITNSPLREAEVDADTLRAFLLAAQPIPRAGEAADVASAALWLASDESSFITGQSIAVDGGLSCEGDARMRGQSFSTGRKI